MSIVIDTTNWGWPQWTLLLFMLCGVVVNALKHGQEYRLESNRRYDFPTSFLGFLITAILLGFGGFFA